VLAGLPDVVGLAGYLSAAFFCLLRVIPNRTYCCVERKSLLARGHFWPVLPASSSSSLVASLYVLMVQNCASSKPTRNLYHDVVALRCDHAFACLYATDA